MQDYLLTSWGPHWERRQRRERQWGSRQCCQQGKPPGDIFVIVFQSLEPGDFLVMKIRDCDDDRWWQSWRLRWEWMTRWQWWWWSWWWTWTWLAPLDAASRMFASSLFCDWGRILTPTFSLICYHKVLFTSFNMRSIPSQSHLQHHDATSIQDVFFRNTVGCQFLIFLMSNLGGKVLSLGAWLLGLWIEELAERWLSSWQYKQG